MNYLILCFASILAVSTGGCSSEPRIAQSVDTAKLLYSQAAIERLKKAIQQRNDQFDEDDKSNEYYSLPQGRAAYLMVYGPRSLQIKKQIEKSESWQNVTSGLSDKEKADNVHFIKTLGDAETIFYPIALNHGDMGYVNLNSRNAYLKDYSGSWVYSYSPPGEYSQANICAMFIYEEMPRQVLPASARNCIHYTDFLIDTNATIFTQRATEYSKFESFKKNTALNELIKLTQDFPGKPVYPEKMSVKVMEGLENEEREWEVRRQTYITEVLSKTERFKKFLHAAYQSVVAEKAPIDGEIDEFESYVERFISADAALRLKRGRSVMGGCSMDKRPITHAANIARLAGETCCMDIFLRAHLNILYDRFERISDGSYAEAGRQTYVRELELTGVNLQYLIPGTLLSSASLAQGHYSGVLDRAGRAISELEDRTKLYRAIESLITDEKLDYYNRIKMVFLARNYNQHLLLFERGEALNNLRKLQNMMKVFPEYIRNPLLSTLP